MLTGSAFVRLPADLPVFRAASLGAAGDGAGRGSWHFDNLIGLVAEISEEVPSGAVTVAADIIVEAQCRNEPVAWVAGTDSIFFPPDFHERGIDLSAVSVIRAGGEAESLMAAEWLIKSGAWGLVIVDVDCQWNISDASLFRIQKVAGRNLCAAVFLTRKRCHDPSLGSGIALRGCVSSSGSGPFIVDVLTIKDRRFHSSSRRRRQYNGSSGMY